MNFFKKIQSFDDIHRDTSRVAAKAMERHTWYLGEQLVVLAFFDPRVPSETRTQNTTISGSCLSVTPRPRDSQKQGLLQHLGSASGLDGEGTRGMDGRCILPSCEEGCICTCVGQRQG